jgi:hypothetical protein
MCAGTSGIQLSSRSLKMTMVLSSLSLLLLQFLEVVVNVVVVPCF